MPAIGTLLRLAVIVLGAAAICISLVDPDVVSRRAREREEQAAAAIEVALHKCASSDPDRAATLGR